MLAWRVRGSKPPEQKEIKEASTYLVTMLLQPMGAEETQIRFKMQKYGEPIWDQTMIESTPPPATSSPAAQQGTSSPDRKEKEPTKK